MAVALRRALDAPIGSLRRIGRRPSWSDGRHIGSVVSTAAPCISRCHDTRASGLDLRLCGLVAVSFVLAVPEDWRFLRCEERTELSPARTASIIRRTAKFGTDDRLTPKDLEALLEPSADNPQPVSLPPPRPGLGSHQWSRHQHVVPISGSPMCGKAYVAHELKRYIEFFHGSRAKVFDISAYKDDETFYEDLKSFFEGDDGRGTSSPSKLAAAQQSTTEDTREGQGDNSDTFCNPNGGFAILSSSDEVESVASKWSAHNKYNRRWMAQTLEKKLDAHVCFIQVSVENDADALDYMDRMAQRRGKTAHEVDEIIKEYSNHYVPIQMDGSEGQTPFIQLINYNEKMIVNRMMQSFVGSRVCQFLSNIHPYQHTVFLSRNGESVYNTLDRLGGDTSLSNRGKEYARRLAEFSTYVVSGKATNLVCVTISAEEAGSLRSRLTKLPVQMKNSEGAPAVFSKGNWSAGSGYGDASGATVIDGMRLVRVQPGFGKDFVDAPTTLKKVQQVVGDGPATLVFVDGDVSQAGEVPARLWTSSLTRTVETAHFVQQPIVTDLNGKPFRQMARRTFRNLDEVYAGVYDGLTMEEITKRDPQVMIDRKNDKLGFRYPRGESYYDIIARLDDVMTNLERIREPILIISHQAVLRVVLAWLTEIGREDSLQLDFPKHTVVRISFDGLGAPRGYTQYQLGPTYGGGCDNL